MKTLPFFITSAVLFGAISAEATGAQSNSMRIDPVAVAQANAALRAAASAAKDLAKNGNIAGTEQAWINLNKAKPNTAEWHLETVQRLLMTAEQLAREGQVRNIGALVTSALGHVNEAESLAKDNQGHAAAKTLAGFIYERYRADPKQALASYRAAAQLMPASKFSQAKEAADRLEKSAETTQAKLNPGK